MYLTQRTIQKEISYTGKGLHTGAKTTITFKPAAPNSKVIFYRKDLPGFPEVPVEVDNVVDIIRGTSIGKGNVKIYTVEHVLASLAGLQIDNIVVELDGVEPPVGDGSALPFVQTLLKAGISDQNVPRNFIEIESPIFYSEKEKKIDLVVLPSFDLRITFMVDYNNPALGTQYTTLVSLEDEFVKEFAPCRTFCFFSELETLYKGGLIKGGDLGNALIICDNNVSPDELGRLKNMFGIKEKVFVGKSGILNDTPLRFPNEPVRHKALDLLGDLFLLGQPIKAHILAARSGHAANVEIARKIKQEFEKNKITKKYQPKKSGDFLLDINAVMRIMPHRYPFLLIDRVLDLEPDKKVTALKNVSINEPYFAGHFPGHPIMPGVLIIEAMAQAGGILLLNTVENPESKVVYFMGIDEVRFRKPVMPGDQLKFELEMLQYRRGTCKMRGKAFVDEELVCEALLMATVVDK